MERSTIFNGKIHYKWPFSIAMLNYQRVGLLENPQVCLPFVDYFLQTWFNKVEMFHSNMFLWTPGQHVGLWNSKKNGKLHGNGNGKEGELEYDEIKIFTTWFLTKWWDQDPDPGQAPGTISSTRFSQLNWISPILSNRDRFINCTLFRFIWSLQTYEFIMFYHVLSRFTG